VTRIVAGRVGGRRLVVPRGETTRPTSERVREALFSGLASRGLPDGARVLDLFCGSGALGLEAASRGAVAVVLVDSSPPAVRAARRNVAELGLDQVTVVHATVERHLAGSPPWPADLVLLDPPYATAEAAVSAVLARLVEGGWLAADAVVVVERSARSPEPSWPEGLLVRGVRRYGETALWTANATPWPDPALLRSAP